MPKASAEMGFRTTGDDLVKMRMKDVCVDAEKTTHDSFDDGAVVFWKFGFLHGREHSFIRELLVNPIHEQVDVFRCRDLDGGLMTVVVCPEIFIFWGGAHDWTGGRGALVAHGTVDEVNLVKKIDDVYSDPIVDVVTIRDFDCFS